MNHPLHALCPYFAMFPPTFVLDQLLAYSQPRDLVLDPFSGRGTTLLEAVLNNRRAIATDVNTVAACISGAKAVVPTKEAVVYRLSELHSKFDPKRYDLSNLPDFFHACYHARTLPQVLYLRTALAWRTDPVDRFIAALVLGSLHGESHRSELCISNRMPRTISTKPEYSVRWWQERGSVAPWRDVFEVLTKVADLRFSKPTPRGEAAIENADARQVGNLFARHRGEVSLVVTSPPYLDMTDYAEDQWLRLWFLGGGDRPKARINYDDRHTVESNYWSFLREVWSSCETLLRDECVIVVRIGGKLPHDYLLEKLGESIRFGLASRVVTLHRASTSDIRKRQTNVFRPGTGGTRQEHDFVFRVQ